MITKLDEFLKNNISEELEIDLSEMEIYEQDLDVEMSFHSKERSAERYGQKVDIKPESIETLVRKAETKIIKFSKSFSSFVLKGLKTNLNVVGELIKRAGKMIFKVITVMIKPNFKPSHIGDKFIEVYENQHKYKIIEV